MKHTLKHEAWDHAVLFDTEEDALEALRTLTEGERTDETDEEWEERIALRWEITPVKTWYEHNATP